MRRSILSALVALVVILAGCNGLALGGDETPTSTVTPADVPTDEPTPTPVPQLAPGFTGEGVTEPFVLAEAHAAVLENTSYTYHENTTARYTNGTVYTHGTTHTQSVANDSRFYIVQSGSNVEVYKTKRLSIWSNGERTLVARTSNNTTSYTARRSANGESAFGGTSSERLAALFSSVKTRVVGQEQRNGTTVYRVAATNVTNPTVLERGWQNPRNVTLRALISSQGLVREYQVNYTATRNSSTVHVNRRIRYTNIGNTTVERPPWYDEASKNISTTASLQ
jgi:hypothetical protein